MMKAKATEAAMAGLNRGASTSAQVAKDIADKDQGSNEYIAAYLAGHIAGLLGMAAARLGHDNARALLASINKTFEAGISIAESAVTTRIQ